MFNHQIQATALRNAITDSTKILIISHKNPDGDTIGSAVAWLHYLTDLGKDVTAFCRDEVPNFLTFLPGIERITNDQSIFDQNYDLIITNDSASFDYAGIDIFKDKINGTLLANIDHHASNISYGDINIVIPTASSNTEVLTRLFRSWDVTITKPMAYGLLTGIITDTDHMTNPGTNYQSLEIAAHLVTVGADLHTIGQKTLRNRSMNTVKLWGLALSRLKHNTTYNIVTTYLTNDDLLECDVNEQEAGGISNYLSLIPNINALIVLRFKGDGSIKGSMRTVKDSIPLHRLAVDYLGGGGHQKAAGFTMQGTLQVKGNSWTIV